jgi:tetratricopeptide (TPR) repeat protein
MRFRGIMTLSLALGLASAPLAGDGGWAVLSPAFESILRKYKDGDRRAAVEGLAAWSHVDLDRQFRALRRAADKGALDPALVKAVVMLHVDRDLADRPRSNESEQPRPCPGRHMRRAAHYARLASEQPETRGFSRRFFLGVAQSAQWDFCDEDALEFARAGLDLFPRDGPLLLTLGATLEERATLGVLPRPRSAPLFHRSDSRGRKAETRESRLKEAERVLAEAVAASPLLVEAHLRLGRVQWRLGKAEAARAALEQARRPTGPAPIRYLAHLYLGQVHLASGRQDDATREFREALEIAPQSQAAAVALSHALWSRGDAAGARAALAPALALAGERERRDAHWDYPAGNASGAEAMLDELRREASR